MKKNSFYKLTILMFLFVFFINSTEMFSQGPPPWASAQGYRAKTRHIYFPEQNFYYDVQKHNYIYFSNNNWEVSFSLPNIFVGINLSKSAQIELDFTGNDPHRYNTVHVVKYKKDKKHKDYKHKKNKSKHIH